MTLKGRKNHYNIKLLRGYGVSVSLKNNKICLRNGIDVLSGKSDTEEWFATKLPYEKIVISGRGYVSTEAIKILCENNKNVILTDTYGHPISFINGGMSSLTGTKYRIAQYDAFRDPEICHNLSKKIIKEKIEDTILTLKDHINHYNIKFIKGYGHSISVKNSKIILKGCHDPFSEPTIEEWFVKRMPYEKTISRYWEYYVTILYMSATSLTA